MPSRKALSALRKRIFEIIEIGAPDDYVSRAYDFINMLAIVIKRDDRVIMYTQMHFSHAHTMEV